MNTLRPRRAFQSLLAATLMLAPLLLGAERAGAQPANDNFANAKSALQFFNGSDTGSIVGATFEAGEPSQFGTAAHKTVWWVWTPNRNDQITFHTNGSTFDTQLAVYTGSSVDALTLVAADEDGAGLPGASLVTFYATMGVPYYISVDGYGTSEGDIALHWSGPANDDFANTITIPPGGIQNLFGTTLWGSKEDGEPIFIDGQGVYSSVWFNWTAPATQQVRIDEIPTGSPTLAGLIAVQTGADIPSLTTVTTAYGGVGTATASFTAVAGTLYHIVIYAAGGNEGDFQLSLIPSPPNDNFIDGILITGNAGQTTGSTIGATLEPSEDPNGGGTIWWVWNPTIAGIATFSTAGSDFDTILRITRGGADLNSTSYIAGDDNNGPGNTSEVVFNTEVGQTYHISVDGAYDTNGNVTLNWEAHVPTPTPTATPANDHCIDAEVICPGTTYTGFIGMADAEGESPCDSPQPHEHDVWFAYTAPAAGTVVMSTCGSDFDTIISVHNACPATTMNYITCSDDSSGPNCSGSNRGEVTFEAEMGMTYIVRLGGYGLNYGVYELDVTGPACPATPSPTATPYDGRQVGDFDNSGCTNIDDFLYLLDFWQVDVGGGAIGVPDFLALLDNWNLGASC